MKKYKTLIPAASHWSLRVRRGMQMTLTDMEGDANVGMVFYNPENLLERYNAPDTLKGQHTFKLTKGHCLYSDMGRIFASIIEDTVGWHETVSGNSHASHIESKWGKRDYQNDRNDWMQNGHDAMLVEMAKYGLTKADIAANLNLFSRVCTDSEGVMSLVEGNSPAGSSVTLRFEMDTLVMLHTCPHPLSKATHYPRKPVAIVLEKAAPVAKDDFCKISRPENQRGFANNELYYFGAEA
ncbi:MULTISPECIES: urea amidolyase associated protein UAAP1 [Marinomonas]|uniref:Urea carboxylase-associated family protein n=1 Tax=Marinomonas arctica TaxID=383750 RepID=A0A7H1JAU8_9GAMM|nr:MULTISPECIES: urea amidolyase associated protein UAAP1 [Marinomonas]MCS7486876.1 urea carboxylase [Marinomonas sp. BSi20414]QNT07614.1 urea carboxylase-associated family protein [Marinomonas arctica]GGN21239.1 urea carboxylase [Marinomonas arctica]